MMWIPPDDEEPDDPSEMEAWEMDAVHGLRAWVAEYLHGLSSDGALDKPRMAESMACEFLGYGSHECSDRPAELIHVLREFPSVDTLGLLDACALVTRDDVARRAFANQTSKMRRHCSAPWHRLIGSAKATGRALGGNGPGRVPPDAGSDSP